ncbi:protease-4 [Peptoclostridium litorale DSM 5388]|uniref:Protease 4 n=1 Tax=Peptoclostridium litorale DSM 5388 TaxID=1121324 RepID=A0A069RHE7_PEPLI|nr:signal peptide peptidase SppA [Peptoclostridium litorale]KDR96198.1 protease 4 [Peptoclostridium litorale DSM 5388]SIO13419.1 protease-4 [Peptoclostridium litorale DSM 5388]
MASKIASGLKRFIKDIVKRFYTLLVTSAVVVIIAVIAFWGIKVISSNIKTIDPGTYVEISMPSDLTENPYMYVDDWAVEKDISMFNMLSAIKAAGTDPNVEGLILDMDSLGFSSQHYDEFEKAVEEYKTSGKKIYAFGNGASQNSYRNALLADSIVMTPSQSASFNITGYYASYSYYKTLFDKWGVSYTVVNTGPYKTYGESYVRDSISDQQREQVLEVYESRLKNFIEDVSEKRGIEKERVQQMVDSGEIYLISPIEAKEKGLIDNLDYRESFIESLAKGDEKPPVIGIEKYVSTNYAESHMKNPASDKIAVIYAEGGIYMSDINPSIIDKEPSIIPSRICAQIEAAAKDDEVKGIVLRVNSPGGSALASEIIHESIQRAKEKKPVYVSMGQVAASGGYYMSAPADKIFAGEDTVTGSIGVVAVIPSVEGLFEKIGINQDTISRGENASVFDISKDMSESEKNALQANIDKVYAEFKSRVSTGRGIEMEQVEKIAGGRVWTGSQALENGLVDELGGLGDAIQALADQLKLEEYSVEVAQNDAGYKKAAFKIREKAAKLAGMDRTHIPAELQKVQEFLDEYDRLEAWSKKPLMLMPVEIED